MGVIQRRRAAVSVSTLPNDVKRSVWEKQDGVNVSRLRDQYMVCSQNARRLSARWHLKERKALWRRNWKSVTSFPLGKYQRESYSANLIQQQSVVKKERGVRSLSTLRNAFFVRIFRVNMVAAIDWRSHNTHDWIWFVIFWGFNGPLRHISVYIGRLRKREKERRKDRRI